MWQSFDPAATFFIPTLREFSQQQSREAPAKMVPRGQISKRCKGKLVLLTFATNKQNMILII